MKEDLHVAAYALYELGGTLMHSPQVPGNREIILLTYQHIH